MIIRNDCSDLTLDEANALIGKTIESVHAEEYSLVLTFTDKTQLQIKGHTYDGLALEANLILLSGTSFQR